MKLIMLAFAGGFRVIGTRHDRYSRLNRLAGHAPLSGVFDFCNGVKARLEWRILKPFQESNVCKARKGPFLKLAVGVFNGAE
jgi:hypothetical protein